MTCAEFDTFILCQSRSDCLRCGTGSGLVSIQLVSRRSESRAVDGDGLLRIRPSARRHFTGTLVMFLLLALFGLCLAAGPAAAAEEPPYSVVLHEGSFEIRDYPALALAEVTAPGDRNSAAYSGFRTLAGYIFGGNARRQSIEMTAPVIELRAGATAGLSSPSSEPQGWVISFVMPRELSLEALPKPNDKAVSLRQSRPTRFAVVRFSGLAGDDSVAAKTAELEAFLARKGLRPIGPPVIAQYDPPWTLWFMRRNEIMIPVGG